MGIALWIIQGLLAAAFAGAGAMKLVKSKTALDANPRMGWAKDFTAAQVHLIGLAEVAGAIGLIVPSALNVVPVLTPVAAACLLALMLGAAAVHVRRKEPPVPPLVLGALALAVAIGRIAVPA
jgi:uncharacterized membrane protein YphA (DoxX/SURF4 family)